MGAGGGACLIAQLVSVVGDRVELNAPLTNSFTSAEGPVVWRYESEGRISNVGVERLSAFGERQWRSAKRTKRSYAIHFRGFSTPSRIAGSETSP